MIKQIHIALIMILSYSLAAQVPFDCLSQVWMLDEEVDRIVTMEINPSNNAIIIQPFVADIGFTLDGLAFRSADNFLYAISSATKELYRIDANGDMQVIAILNLPMDEDHDAFGMTADGNRVVLLGNKNSRMENIYLFNFGNWDNPTIIPGTASLDITDLTINPVDGLFYGVNQNDGRVVSFDPNSLRFTGLGIPNPGDRFSLTYSDAFGGVFAFGSAQFDVASGLFEINTSELSNRILTNGPESNMKDIAACPFNVGLQCIVDPQFSFPCNDITYTYRIANATGRSLNNCDLLSDLPVGFKFDELMTNNIDGNVTFDDDQFDVREFSLPVGITDLSFTVELSETLGPGNYFSSFKVDGLPATIGNSAISDNPRTVRQNDETRLEIRVLDSDMEERDFFFCTHVPAFLDGTPFGTSYEWSTGEETDTIEVFESGLYSLVAQTGCQLVTVMFDVTVASCPFTIDMDHIIEPDSIFPCNEVMYKFAVNNDSGETQVGIDFVDTLGAGITYVSLLNNPFGGEDESQGNILSLTGMEIPLGIDSIIFLVEVGNVSAGEYPNGAIIKNFPEKLGTFRESDNPKTLEFDSTTLVVLGTDVDSLFVPEVLCNGESLILDGSIYGTEFEWFNGSTESQVEINDIGIYELRIFTGCQVSFVFFEVVEGEPIDIEIESLENQIALGDSLFLEPRIITASDSVSFAWRDPHENSLSCPDCLSTYASPYWDTEYIFTASNEICSDSITISIEVDNTRRLYTPNILSLSEVGDNQFFFIQSPDFGVIEQLYIYDRYGSVVYSSNDPSFETNRWGGRNGSDKLVSGVYVWQAQITFLDELTESFSGTVTIIE